jgi:hypothetical protein
LRFFGLACRTDNSLRDAKSRADHQYCGTRLFVMGLSLLLYWFLTLMFFSSMSGDHHYQLGRRMG